MGEGEVCMDMDVVVSDNVSENKNSPRNQLKRDHEFIANGNGTEEPYTVSVKKQVKEALNEDTRSEVSDPIVSPPKINELAVGCTPSKSAELVSKSPVVGVVCNEVTSKCSGNLSNEENDETLSHEDNSAGCMDLESNGRNDVPDSSLTSRIVLEIPKDVSTTGIRKITFKLNKKKDDHGGEVTCNDTSNGLKYGSFKEKHEQDFLVLGHNPQFCAPNMELKMSKKVVHANYLTNVKKLLSTGILDGAPVKYMSPTQQELSGIIAGGGYLCGCSSCNFSRVLTAYEFEQHAGSKTKHPNNHIFLENGRPIYSIIQELKTAPTGILEEVIKDAAGSAINEEFFQMWKENLIRSEMRDEPEESKQNTSNLPSLPHSYSSYRSQSLGDIKRLPQFFPMEENPLKYVDTVEKQKRATKKPSSCDYYSYVKQKKASEGRSKRRDNDLHKLVFMPNGLSDGAELAYFVKGQRILGGYKQGNGIVCDCCHKEISPSQFEAHAGMSVRRQPYKHIYTSNGLSLHDIAISLLNGNSIATGGSDDMCSICGEGGNLILCAECPRAFHTACLGLHSIPESSWCCSSCSDKPVPARKVTAGDSAPAKSIVLRLKRVVKMPEFEIGGCAICRDHDFSVGAFDERTILLCDQCEREFHVGCLREKGLCDLKEIPKDKWFCCDGCEKIYMALQESVANGLETISLLSLHTINRKHIERGLLVGSAGNDVQWRIISGKSRCPEDLPFLSKATAIFRECFDPIVAQSGRDLIPVMVYGRNISGQEFGGMYCVVLMAKSVVVSAGLLRIFGQEVAELPLVATTREHQGKGYFQALFSCVEGLLCSLNVEKLVLPAAEEAESIWTRRFGFKRMTEEQLKKHMREVQLTIFKGTSMLEKDIRR